MSDCLFCKIAAGKIPVQKVHEDDLSLGFLDISPQAPHHALFIPKRHIATMNDATGEDRALLGGLLVSAAQYAREKGLSESGYRLAINTNRDAGQSVFHVHVHLLGGHQLQLRLG